MNWLRLAALSLVIGMMWAQGQSQQQMPECGLGLDRGHPRSHCRCDDGEMCHFAHSAADDQPARRKK